VHSFARRGRMKFSKSATARGEIRTFMTVQD
jgi:hypothetical protein